MVFERRSAILKKTDEHPKNNKWISLIGGVVVVSGMIILGIIAASNYLHKRSESNSYSDSALELLDCGSGIKLEIVKIPAGTFMMGSPSSEDGREDGEEQHKVTISKSFYIGACEVTQAQYRAIIGENPSHFKGDELPVENISLGEAAVFCHKLSEKIGRNVRLPTEAEWEYVCRTGTTTPFSFGETISTDQANYNGDYTYGNGSEGINRDRTTPVGSFPVNAWGLYDMHGNVAEWCADWYKDYAEGDAIDPSGASYGSYRVIRGGSWGHDPKYCRSAFRVGIVPSFRRNFLGFRVALDS